MSDMERQMTSSMKMVVYFMPLMSVFFGFIWPQGLTLYWMTAALFMVGQQFQLMGWGSLRVPPWMPGAGRVTPLSYSRADFGSAAPQGAAAGGSVGTKLVAPATNGARRSSAPAASRAPASPGRGRAPSRSQRKARRRR